MTTNSDLIIESFHALVKAAAIFLTKGVVFVKKMLDFRSAEWYNGENSDKSHSSHWRVNDDTK